MTYTVGVDIGGTKVAIALVNQKGKIIKKIIIPTDQTITPAKMIQHINDTISKLIDEMGLKRTTIKGIGIGSPGPLDSKNGIISCPPNLPKWLNIPIAAQVHDYFSLPVRLENDANAAAMAEKWLGAAQENDNFTYMTISTGIGAGIYADGRLLEGSRGNAGDFGHTVVDPSYGKCTCGQYGCLEYIASGTAIARKGSEIKGRPLTTEQVFDLYHQGDEEITPYIQDVFRVLGIACVSLINTLDPEKIVIGGGVSKVGDSLFKPIREYVSKYALSPEGRKTIIVPAQLDQDAGVIGAAALAFQL